MANIKITDLTAYGDPTSTDVLPIVDVGADVTKKVSIADLLENAGSGTASAPGIAFDGDPDTGIYRPGANQVAVSTNGTEAARIDSSGRLLVGTSTSITTAGLSSNLQVAGTGANGSSMILRRDSNDGEAPAIALGKSRGSLGSATIVSNNDVLGYIYFAGADGTDANSYAAWIKAEVDGTPGANDMPGRLVFSSTPSGSASPVERMIIKNNGNILVGSNSDAGFTFQVSKASAAAGYFNRDTDDGAVVGFGRQASLVGSISVTTTATTYNTSSDYRLKENITPVTDGITCLQQLKPSRFNFIADPGTVVDGFIAHEVQAVVPEAITGEKDAVDDEGNPIYQGIDQSKLVPLLTAALQEAIGRIETLEAEVTALKG